MKRSILENRTFMVVISIIGSLLIWIMVAYNIDTTIAATIKNVPVIINLADGSLNRFDLDPVADSLEFTVDVEVMGPRATIGNIKPSEIKVEARMNNVTGPGTYDLALEVSDIRNRGIEIKGTFPETISMRFDREVTKRLPVNLNMLGVTIPDGFVMEEESVYPAEIEITGPESEMKQVKVADVTINFEKPLTESLVKNVDVQLKDSDGNDVDSPYFTYDTKEVSVTVPVLKKKTVPVTFDFVNIPEGFDVDILDYEISPTEIEVAGPENMLSSLNEIHVGYIDIRNLAPDVNFFYDLSLPEGFISVEGVEDMNLQFKPHNFDVKELTMDSDSIYVINASDKYDVTIQSKGISNVTVYGLKDDLEMVTAKDLVAQVDMNQVEYKLGQITVPVEIILPGNDTCWAYGTHYTVRATVKEK